MKVQIPHIPFITPVAATVASACAIVALAMLWPQTISALESTPSIVLPTLIGAAALLLLCSIALCALEYGQRAIAVVLAGSIAIAVTFTIASWVLDIPPPLHFFLFGLPITADTFFPTAAARDAAIPVALAPLAIVLLALKIGRNVFRPLGWAAGLMLLLAPVIVFITSQFAPADPLPQSHNVAATAPTILIWLAASLFGAALMASRHTSSIADGARTTTDWSARLRAAIVAAVVIATLMFWHTMRAAEIRQLQAEVQTAARSVVVNWQSGLNDRLRATARLKDHWMHLGWKISDEIFLADCRAFLDDYPGMHAIVVTDAQGKITKIARRDITLGATPTATDDALLDSPESPGFPLLLTRTAVEIAQHAIAARVRTRSDPVSLDNGAVLLMSAIPAIDAAGRPLGAFVTVFRRDISDAALLDGVAPNFHLRVFTNGLLSYNRAALGDNSLGSPRPYTVSEQVKTTFSRYDFEVAPGSRIIARNLTWTPALVLVFAWSALILITFALYNERRAVSLARDRERILNESLDLICTLDAHGRYVTVNDTSLPVLGYTPNEIIGRQYTELAHPAERELLAKMWADAQNGIRPPAIPIRFLRKDGSTVYLQGNAHWSPREQLFYCDMRDVSEQHALELAREHAASTLSTGVEQAGCVVYEYLYDSQHIVWVGALHALTGYEPEELTSTGFEGWMQAIHPDDRTHVRKTLKRCLETRQPHTIDYRLRRKDGEYVPVLDRGRHVEDAAHRQPRMIGALIDLSAIRQQEDALRRSEERYRIIATQVGAVIMEREIGTNRVRVFGPVEQIYGFTKEQIESRPYGPNDTMVHADDRARVNATVAEAEENLSSYYLEYRRRRRGGQYIHIASRGVVLPGPDGRAERAVIAVTDITERKLAEERLQESEERFRLAAEQAGQIVYEYVFGEKLEIVGLRLAGATEQVFGYTADDLRTLPTADRFGLIHPDDIPSVRSAGGESLGESYQFNVEHRLRHRDGHYVHVENRGAVRRDAQGNITGVVGMLLDISERKAAETERLSYTAQLGKLADIARKVSTLLSLHELLNYLARSMRELLGVNASAAFVFDTQAPTGRVTAVSYAEHYGVQRGEPTAFGSPELHELLTGSDRPMRLTVEQMSADPRFALLTQSDDLEHPMRGWLAAPLIARDGVNLGLLQVTDKTEGDFTESDAQVLSQLAGLTSVAIENIRLYATLEDRVAARTRELQMSNRELEAFSYSVSHDLRAPLRAIAGFSSILEQEYAPKLDNAAQRYIQRIGSGVERMANLIDDLLSLARVSRLELKRETIDLTALSRTISKRQVERWPERKLQIKIDPRLRVSADPRLVEVALENLIENAIKFTGTRAEAQIHIGKRTVNGRPAFFVGDNGVGFDPQYATNLFGVFQRLHSVSEFPGTGVGLATVQRILQRHQGRVWAESQIDSGATFYFTFDSEA